MPEEIKCDSGIFLLVKDFERAKKVVTETSIYVLDLKTLKEWAGKTGSIDEEDRVFCIASEIQIQREIKEIIKLVQDGRVVFSSV